MIAKLRPVLSEGIYDTRRLTSVPIRPNLGAMFRVALFRRQGSERHIQRINEPSGLVGELNFAAQLLSKGPDHAGAEASPTRRLDERATFFSPCQSEPLS